jgi:hypothetical protein
MSGLESEEDNYQSQMENKCALLRGELKEVLAEYDAPKFSDQCDDDPSPLTNSITMKGVEGN